MVSGVCHVEYLCPITVSCHILYEESPTYLARRSSRASLSLYLGHKHELQLSPVSHRRHRRSRSHSNRDSNHPVIGGLCEGGENRQQSVAQRPNGIPPL